MIAFARSGDNPSELLAVTVRELDTPATRTGSHYALVPARAVRSLSGGALKLLSVLASLRRKKVTLTLAYAELVESVGCCERSFRTYRRSLEEHGFLRPRSLVLTRRARKGRHYARLDTRKLALATPAEWRAYAVCRLFADRNGRMTKAWSQIAVYLGVTARQVRRLLAGLRLLGITIPAAWRGAAAKSVRQVINHGC